jgi:hypothetical protein
MGIAGAPNGNPLKTTGSKPVESNATESRLKGVAHALLRAAFTIV